MELEHFGGLFAPGYTLSIEERAALEVQMAKKQMEEKLHRCAFIPCCCCCPSPPLAPSSPLPPTPPLPRLPLPLLLLAACASGAA